MEQSKTMVRKTDNIVQRPTVKLDYYYKRSLNRTMNFGKKNFTTLKETVELFLFSLGVAGNGLRNWLGDGRRKINFKNLAMK